MAHSHIKYVKFKFEVEDVVLKYLLEIPTLPKSNPNAVISHP